MSLPPPTTSSAVVWHAWGDTAFARARVEGKPVLLSITTEWCRWSREMDASTFADPSIAAVINRAFVPVRVDADRRPDIAERYALGGWPTTAFLSPGGAILGGGTFVARDRMAQVLTQVVDAFARSAGSLPETAPARPPAADGVDPDRVQARILDAFDPVHGGFGGAPKFPHVAPVRLALELWKERRDDHLERVVVTTLDRMGWGPLYDDVDGGFFRCSLRQDWADPEMEKLLDVNASLIRLYLDAADAFGVARFGERAADVLRYTQTWLADPVDGGWAASQQADEAYYAAQSSDTRRNLVPPGVPRVLYTDANAAMACAALQAGRRFDDRELTAAGITALERVLVAGYRPGAGVAHCVEEGEPVVRGLLGDQVAAAAACLDAFEVTGNVVYEMMAQELAHYMIRLLWDEEDGGFFDAAAAQDSPPLGLLSQPLKPFVVNCEAVSVLRRLAVGSGDADFARRADATLQALAPRAGGQGILGAHYLLAGRPPVER